MSWIKMIGYVEADSTLKKVYNRVKGPNSSIDNVLAIHSLRPHSLIGHMTLYKSVLHNTNNTLPRNGTKPKTKLPKSGLLGPIEPYSEKT